MLRSWVVALFLLVCSVSAHTVISYPGWRGNNLVTNDTFPYGMQWQYPCGGFNKPHNRTKWPIKGGAVAVQPGWFAGHKTAFFYMNMGFGTDGPYGGPPNMSFPMLPVFEIVGPTKDLYNGTFCLPQVPLPVNATAKVGDNVTIQIVELAVHGAALYNCVDVTLADPEDVEDVTQDNCFNSTTIGFNQVYATESLTSGAAAPPRLLSTLAFIAPLALVMGHLFS